jgi:hypothetical protein
MDLRMIGPDPRMPEDISDAVNYIYDSLNNEFC